MTRLPDYSDGSLPPKGSEADLLRTIFGLFTVAEVEGFRNDLEEYHPDMVWLYDRLMKDWGIAEEEEPIVGHCDLCGGEHKEPVRYDILGG